MGEFDIGKVLGNDICDYIAPKLGDVEDIGLVNAAEFASSLAGNIT
jgi:hypothetical protein